jgi:hypothetical protein
MDPHEAETRIRRWWGKTCEEAEASARRTHADNIPLKWTLLKLTTTTAGDQRAEEWERDPSSPSINILLTIQATHIIAGEGVITDLEGWARLLAVEEGLTGFSLNEIRVTVSELFADGLIGMVVV